VAGADDVEGTVEMALDGADGHAGGKGDLRDLHLFEEAEEEDGALAGERVPTVCQMWVTCCWAMRWDSAVDSRLGRLAAMSATSTELVERCFQKRKRPVRVWSRARLRAMRMSQVGTEQSARKLARADQARRKVSWVRVSAASRSRRVARRKRKTRG